MLKLKLLLLFTTTTLLGSSCIVSAAANDEDVTSLRRNLKSVFNVQRTGFKYGSSTSRPDAHKAKQLIHHAKEIGLINEEDAWKLHAFTQYQKDDSLTESQVNGVFDKVAITQASVYRAMKKDAAVNHKITKDEAERLLKNFGHIKKFSQEDITRLVKAVHKAEEDTQRLYKKEDREGKSIDELETLTEEDESFEKNNGGRKRKRRERKRKRRDRRVYYKRQDYRGKAGRIDMDSNRHFEQYRK